MSPLFTNWKTATAISIIAIGAVVVFGGFSTEQENIRLPIEKEYTIELRDDGFYPQQLTVQKGADVIFSTTRDKAFWPASDTHPTHKVYSKFDPREPIDPSETWTFTFNRPGTWDFHDHLAPRFNGAIVVSDSSKYRTILPSCDNGDNEDIQLCWRSRIADIVKEDGIDAGLTFLEDHLKEEPNFELQCHLAAHHVGEALFKEFIKNPNRPLPQGMDRCTFGAFHGFMETLVSEGYDIETAHEFCRSIKDEGIIKGVDNIHECYHGIGHGIGEMNYLPNPDDITKGYEPALRDCEENMKTDLERRSCALGIFGTLMNGAQQFEREGKNPIEFCSSQSDTYRDVCLHGAIRHYGNFHTKYFEEFTRFIFAMDDRETAESLAINFTDPLALSFEDLWQCHKRGEAAFTDCIERLPKPTN